MTTASPEIPDDELIAYVLGDLSTERSRAIADLAAADDELAGEIAVLRLMAGVAVSPDPEIIPFAKGQAAARPVRKAPPRSWRKLAVAAVLALVVLGGLGWAGWVVLLNPPLLNDDFEDGWYDASLWDAPPDWIPKAAVKEEKGFLRLVNRGYLVTQKEFPMPIEVKLRWKWIDLTTNPFYADHLAVALRTSGKARLQRPHEVSDGIVVRFNAFMGAVLIASAPDFSDLRETEMGLLPMAANEWHDIRITDDGETISVYITSPAIDPKYETTPVLQMQAKAKSGHHHVAIYNREWVESPHESYLDYVRIETFRKEN